MKYLLLAILLFPMSFFGAGLTVSTTNGFSYNLASDHPRSTNAAFYGNSGDSAGIRCIGDAVLSSNILVSGAAGFVGSVTILGQTEAQNANFHVTGLSPSMHVYSPNTNGQTILGAGSVTYSNLNGTATSDGGNLNAGNTGNPTMTSSNIWVVQSSQLNGGKNIVTNNQARIENSVADSGTNLVNGMHSTITRSRAGDGADNPGLDRIDQRYSSIENCKVDALGVNYIQRTADYGYDTIRNSNITSGGTNLIDAWGYNSMENVNANGGLNLISNVSYATMKNVDNEQGLAIIAGSANAGILEDIHIANGGEVSIYGDSAYARDVTASNGHYARVTGNRSGIVNCYGTDCDTLNAGNDSIIFGEGYTNNADHVLVYVTCGQPPVIIDRNTGTVIGNFTGNLNGGTNLSTAPAVIRQWVDNSFDHDTGKIMAINESGDAGNMATTLLNIGAGQIESGTLDPARLPAGVPTSVTTLIGTNFPTGTVISNSFGHVIEISANAVLTEAGVAGRSQLSLEAVGVKTNRYGQVTALGIATGAATNYLAIKVPIAGNYIWRDTSTGAGNSALVSDGQITVFP